jgi:ArsR family transcriptional regulator
MITTTLPAITRAAQVFHALSDETRLEIVRLLSHGERCVCELQQVLEAAQSRLSFHLKTLKDAGLVSDRRDGRWVYYALNRDALDEIAEFAAAVKPGKHAGSCAQACCSP